MATESVVRVEHVSTRYDHLVVHRDVSLEIAAGEIVGLVGGSGSGKTTLMREMLGLQAPTEGQVYLFGQPLFPDRPEVKHLLRDRVGVLFQGGALFSALDVYDNVAFPLREHGVREDLVADLVRMLLGLAGLTGAAAHRVPAELSSGMVTRAALARSLALGPDLLFFDEPTTGLDPVAGQEFVELVRSLHQDLGFSVFMITHDLMTLRDLCQRVAVLADQQVVACGPLDEVLACPHPFIESFFQGARGRQVLSRGR
jgi:phospholipid/cholesterol/gamma-HCH transport system ATP-binding protein